MVVAVQEVCVGECRIVRCTGNSYNKIQQKWKTVTYENGKPTAELYEWRDVPFVQEKEKTS